MQYDYPLNSETYYETRTMEFYGNPDITYYKETYKLHGFHFFTLPVRVNLSKGRTDGISFFYLQKGEWITFDRIDDNPNNHELHNMYREDYKHPGTVIKTNNNINLNKCYEMQMVWNYNYYACSDCRFSISRDTHNNIVYPWHISSMGYFLALLGSPFNATPRSLNMILQDIRGFIQAYYFLRDEGKNFSLEIMEVGCSGDTVAAINRRLENKRQAR